MNTLTRRAAVSVTALALVVAPVSAAVGSTPSNSSLRKQAEKYCKAQEKKLGTKKFNRKYGPKNALGKCVSTYEKTHKK